MTHKTIAEMIVRRRRKIIKFLKELTGFKQAGKVCRPAQLINRQKRNIVYSAGYYKQSEIQNRYEIKLKVQPGECSQC